MAKKRRRKNSEGRRSTASALRQRGRWIWLGATLLVILGSVGLFLVMSQDLAPSSDALYAEAVPSVTTEPMSDELLPGALPAGRANYCQQGPTFPDQLGFDTQTYVGTSLDGYMGLTLSDATGRVYQDDTWDDAGFLGPFIYDRLGNIYTAPSPFINLEHNAPEEQNKIYRVDAITGEMAKWIDLPAAQTSTQLNPFGVLGLFYDCDTDSIFAGSVAGSSAGEEVGRIFRVDRETGEVAHVYDDVDAMGVGVFNGVSGKRLYFGSGRDSGVRSIALDEQGNTVGEPRVEFFLAQFDEGGNEKAQRITFTADDLMIVKGVDFNYSLRSSSDALRVLYTFAFDPATDGWNLDSVERTDQ